MEHLRWHTLASPNSVIAFGPAHAVLFIKNHLVGCRNCWSHCSPPHSPDCLPSQGGVQVYLSICWYVTHVCFTSVKVVCEPYLTFSLHVQSILTAEPSYTGRSCLKSTMKTLLRIAASCKLPETPTSADLQMWVAWVLLGRAWASPTLVSRIGIFHILFIFFLAYVVPYILNAVI